MTEEENSEPAHMPYIAAAYSRSVKKVRARIRPGSHVESDHISWPVVRRG